MRLKQQILWMKKIILFINFYFKWLHQIIVVEFLSCYVQDCQSSHNLKKNASLFFLIKAINYFNFHAYTLPIYFFKIFR